MRSNKIMMVAGEASGDLHGTRLMEEIQRLDSEIHFWGVGGKGMERRGMELLYRSESLSVVGITEVLFKLRFTLKVLNDLKAALEREKPDLVILIDFPDFNLRLAKAAHQKGIPVLYYISPQVWAWRPGRVKQIARWVEKIIVFFPFEVPIYEAAGADVEWVGHPLLDIVKPTLSEEEAFRRFGIEPGRRMVGLLPGSRVHEVDRLLPNLLGAAELIQKEIPEVRFIMPLAPGLSQTVFLPWLEKASIPVNVVEGWTYDVMNISELLITASGTATLEGGILGKPMVIVYRVSFLSYLIGRLLIRVEHIGLSNLVAGKGIAPELIQGDVNPERIAREALRILKDRGLRDEMARSMTRVRENLGDPGAAGRAARIVLSMLHKEDSRVQGAKDSSEILKN